MPRRTSQYVEALSDARTKLGDFFNILPNAMRARPATPNQ
jgi:hypothetical protein